MFRSFSSGRVMCGRQDRKEEGNDFPEKKKEKYAECNAAVTMLLEPRIVKLASSNPARDGA